jgi:hypothetical protein
MPPKNPPSPFSATASLGVVRDANGRVVGTVSPSPEFLRWLNEVLQSLKSAS